MCPKFLEKCAVAIDVEVHKKCAMSESTHDAVKSAHVS
jgi:hypothetical protein